VADPCLARVSRAAELLLLKTEARLAALSSWLVLSAAALGYLGFVLFAKTGDRRLFLPGETTNGHYQMELECSACHGEPFATAEALQAACERCHAQELETAHDAHPRSKFTDPRNANRVARLDARRCTTCHREHWPEGTNGMGLTLQLDYCYLCHEDVGRERPSHAGLSHFSCADTGCHNFHDNRALYEEFLVAHAAQPELLAVRPASPARARIAERALTLAERDAPAQVTLPDAELSAWLGSAHARAAVNCGGCHQTPVGWRDTVSVETCANCHAAERDGWVLGRHGMRVGLGLPAVTPAEARAPMHSDASGEPLGCTSCHGAHGFDRQVAAVQSCQSCHDDVHSRAYAGSPHHLTWLAEQSGAAPPNSGVSCATCHMPLGENEGGRRVVEHNQNDNLRPRDKMLRSVCGNCHGLGFSIDALADTALVDSNFTGRPPRHVPSIDWAVARLRELTPEPPPTSGD
jgi:hypothetical protein